MKAVLWKPFQRWTGSLYSNYRSSNGTNKSNNKSRVELTSQDPIVDDNEAGGNYRLNSMEFGKRSSLTVTRKAGHRRKKTSTNQNSKSAKRPAFRSRVSAAMRISRGRTSTTPMRFQPTNAFAIPSLLITMRRPTSIGIEHFSSMSPYLLRSATNNMPQWSNR
jgi:hypothetical protein